MIRMVVIGSHTYVSCPRGHIKEEDLLHYDFCVECGIRLSRRDDGWKVLQCDVCGTSEVTEEMNFCPHCGTIATGPSTKLSYEK